MNSSDKDDELPNLLDDLAEAEAAADIEQASELQRKIGRFYKRAQQFEAALPHMKAARDGFRQLGRQGRVADSDVDLGLCYSDQDQYAQAEDHLMKARGSTSMCKTTRASQYARTALRSLPCNLAVRRKP